MSVKLFLVLSLLLFSTTKTSATTSSPSGEKRGIRQEVRTEQKELREDKKEEFKEKMGEVRSNVAERHSNRLERRFGFYHTRFTNIIKRLETRIATLKTEGKDVSLVTTKLEKVKVTLASAKAKGDEAVAAFRAIDPAKFSEQKEQAMKARDIATSARNLFKQVHTELQEVFAELKKI